MADERHLQPGIDDEDVSLSSDPDPALEALRDILLNPYRQRIKELEAEVEVLEQRVTDKDALIATISPVMGDAIHRQIQDSREEMIDALYPIIGQLVMRAVSEAVKELARTVDAQVRHSFDFRSWWWRIRARLGGASAADAALRASLPFEVKELFLIHRETGLLLWHASHFAHQTEDSELIGSMLTAIRDFTKDAFGQDKEGELEEIEYGDERILLETTRYSYLAVVIIGVEPPGFRAEMRDRSIQIDHRFADVLRHYEGDASPLSAVSDILLPLITVGNSSGAAI